jgi:hypothetical protein
VPGTHRLDRRFRLKLAGLSPSTVMLCPACSAELTGTNGVTLPTACKQGARVCFGPVLFCGTVFRLGTLLLPQADASGRRRSAPERDRPSLARWTILHAGGYRTPMARENQEGASMKGSSVAHLPITWALTLSALVGPGMAPADAETAAFPKIPVIRTQLTISPTVPAPAPAPARRPAPRVARPAPAPAPRAAPVPTPAPAPAAPAPVPDPVLREASEQLLKQVGDLARRVGDLNAQTNSLTAQVGNLNGVVGLLQQQLADTEGRLKEEVDRTAATPFQALELSGVVEKGVSANIDRLFQTLWPNIAVPTALFLLLCALFGTMVVGIPVRALLNLVPSREAGSPARGERKEPNVAG